MRQRVKLHQGGKRTVALITVLLFKHYLMTVLLSLTRSASDSLNVSFHNTLEFGAFVWRAFVRLWCGIWLCLQHSGQRLHLLLRKCASTPTGCHKKSVKKKHEWNRYI